MFGIHNYTCFVLAIIAFQIIPGPGTLAILSATARHGIRSGMGAVFGTLAGDLLFMLAGGANPAARTRQGDSPLDVAVSFERRDVVTVLTNSIPTTKLEK